MGNTVTLENILTSDNVMRGVYAEAKTSFTGNQIYAERNGWSGVEVDTCWDWDDDGTCNNIGTGTVALKMSSSTENGGNGYNILAKGAITIADTYLAGNGESGYYLDNSMATAPAAITLTNTNSYDNGQDGYEIYSRGAVTLNNFHGSDNDLGGLYVNTCIDWDDDGVCNNTGTGTVTLTNTGAAFNETARNGENGLSIISKGAITIINTDTYENGGLGAYIDNSGATTAAPVTIKVNVPATTWNGYSANGEGGVEIFSRGTVTISDMSADYNGGTGAFIFNIPPGLAAGNAVTISDSDFFMNNDGDDLTTEDGLVVISKGAITLLNVSSTENFGTGAVLNNMAGTAGVTINAGTNRGNYFLWNAEDGLFIQTNGAVLLTNINASGNDEMGAFIDNRTGTAGVTIKETGNWGMGINLDDLWSYGSSFSHNDSNGLVILTDGAVSVTYNLASYNGNNGIIIDNTSGTGTVSLLGNPATWGDAFGNGSSGINVFSKGNVTFSYVNASENGDFGGIIVNYPGTGSVTLTNALFEYNRSGLSIITSGAVTWKYGSAWDNYEAGAFINNLVDVLPGKPVTISNVEANENGETGLTIISKGAVTITNVSANNNSANYYEIEYGQTWHDNMSNDQTWWFAGTGGESVTISVDSDNFTPSFYITDSDGNYIDGADGFEGSASVTFTLPGLISGEYQIHLLTDMGWDGLGYDISIYDGPTAPSDWDEYSNEASGIFVDNSEGINVPVSITNTYGTWNGNNSATDIIVLSSGAVTLSNMDLNDSSGNGLLIDNTTVGLTSPGVTLTNVNFYNNDGSGAEVYTDGAIVIKGSNANGNGGYGYNLDNDSGNAPVTLTGFDVNVNGDTGILVSSKGALTLTTVYSSGNYGTGLDLTTLGAVTFNGVNAYGNMGYGALVVTPSTFTIIQPAVGGNSFGNNMLDGLNVTAGGKITLAKVNANGNGWWIDDDTIDTYAYGIYLDNDAYLFGTAPVSLTNLQTSWNTVDGLFITTASAVTLTGANAEENINFGIRLYQVPGPALAPVITLTDITTNYNGMDGLYVDVYGNIITNKLNSMGNGGTGANLLTQGNGTVTVLNTKGYNFVGFNGGVGLNIESDRAVNVTGVEALGNTQDGVVIWNDTSASVPATVTVNSLLLRSNGLTGLAIHSYGVVTVNNTWAVSNGQDDTPPLNASRDGILIVTYANTFINNSNAINNAWAGIYVNMVPAIPDPIIYTLKLTNSTWMGNLRDDPYSGDRNLMVIGNYVIL